MITTAMKHCIIITFSILHKKRKQQSHATSKSCSFWSMPVAFPGILCIQKDWLCSIILRSSHEHGLSSCWGFSRCLQGLQNQSGKVRRRAEATYQESGICKLFQDIDGLMMVFGFQMVRRSLTFSPKPLLLLAVVCTARHPHTWVFSLRRFFLFLLPIQFPSGKLVIYPIGLKSNYGVGSNDLPEGLCFRVPEHSAAGGCLAWSTDRASKE